MHEYDVIADWYSGQRSDVIEPEVQWFMASVPRGGTVLDVGCGTGRPITRALLDSGVSVVGVDSSARMLERFRVNCPTATAIESQIQSCDFVRMTFDAAIAWGVLFHLEHAEQRKAIAKVSEVLKRGGLFLFTSGQEDGTKQGVPMNGVPFRYWSFDVDGYRELLRENQLRLTRAHKDAGENIYYLAAKE
jgi:SAM-dependent methyltransferase